MKLKPSIARTNLLSSSASSYHYHHDSASNSSDEFIEITELHKSISSKSSLESLMLINDSQTSLNVNFLLNAPSTSTTMLNNIDYDMPSLNVLQANDKNSKYISDGDEDVLGIGFTRNQMKKRLENLVKNAVKSFKGDIEVWKLKIA